MLRWLALASRPLKLIAQYQVVARIGARLGALQQSIERVEYGDLPTDGVDSLGRAVFPFLAGGPASGGQGSSHEHLQLYAPAVA